MDCIAMLNSIPIESQKEIPTTVQNCKRSNLAQFRCPLQAFLIHPVNSRVSGSKGMKSKLVLCLD